MRRITTGATTMNIPDRLLKDMSTLITRSCDAMCDQEVWSKKDHKLLVDTIDWLKEEIAESSVIMRAVKRCLDGYYPEEWEKNK